MISQQRDLKRTDFVGDVPVAGNGVRSGSEEIDHPPLHRPGDHVVRQHRSIKAHLGKAACGQPRSLKIRPGFGTEYPEGFSLFFCRADQGADHGLAVALCQDAAALRDPFRQPVADGLHGTVASVQRSDGVFHDRFDRVLAGFQCSLRQSSRAECNLPVAVCCRRPGIRKILSRLLQKSKLPFFVQIPSLMRRKRHSHADRRIRPRTLGHHVGDGLPDFPVVRAFHKTDFRRIDAPIQDTDFPGLVPGNIFIFQEKGHALIHAFHDSTASFQTVPSVLFLPGSLHGF